MTDTYAAAIDSASIQQNWPKSHAFPAVIDELAALMSPWPWGALGHWRLRGESFGEFWSNWCRQGGDLDGDFGIFMEFASGRKYGVWYHDDDAPGAHPIVDFGDEGGVSILAPNLKTFLTQWASGHGIGWLEPFDYEESAEVLTQRHAYGAQMLALINQMPDVPAGQPIVRLQTRLDATVAAAQAVADEAERQKRLIEPYGDRIDLALPEKFWPAGQVFPTLIREIGELMKPAVNGSVGRYDMNSQRMSDTWFDNSADLHAQFGFFLVDHRYRNVAVWYHDGAVQGSEPIVDFRGMSFDQDDDVAVAAPNLAAYVTTWANAVLEGDPRYDLNQEPEIAAQRPALAARMLDLVQKAGPPPAPAPVPDLVAFIRAHIAAQRAKDAADPLLQAMAHILKARFPAPTDVLWLSIFATIAGDEMAYSLTSQDLDAASFPEGATLTPLLFEARAARARGATNSLGPWTSAQLSLYPDGRISLAAYWE